MKLKFTSEELKGIKKQPIDTCPFLNNILMSISSFKKGMPNPINDIFENLELSTQNMSAIKEWQSEWVSNFNKIKSKLV